MGSREGGGSGRWDLGDGDHNTNFWMRGQPTGGVSVEAVSMATDVLPLSGKGIRDG